jgi:hypothetical protein
MDPANVRGANEARRIKARINLGERIIRIENSDFIQILSVIQVTNSYGSL